MRLKCGAFLLGVLLVAQPGWSQTLTTLLTNGPTANRINIVVLSEGYQAGELGTFLSNATSAVNSLLATPPYREYSNYFNAFAISVASAQSGSDHHTPVTALVDTYFNSSYDNHGLDRLIMIPPNDWDTNYADGLGKVDALLQTFMPEYDLVMLLVNDTRYGGSGGTPFIASVSSSVSEVVAHESGHAFGHLADEYATPLAGWVTAEYPNVTAQTNRPAIRWNPWIAAATPIPTPATDTVDVGLFQGAEYQTAGWYRPKCDCKMNHLGVVFCEVCGEQLVRSIYRTINSIDAFTPTTTVASVTTTNDLRFNITPLRPVTHNLNVQWLTNGISVSGATNTSFSLLPQFFANGPNTVQAQVHDVTPLVRSDPANVLSNSVTWNLNVQLGALRLLSATVLSGGRFTCQVTGSAPRGFVIEASTNLVDWVPIATNAITGGQCGYTNGGAGAFAARYYRAFAVP